LYLYENDGGGGYISNYVNIAANGGRSLVQFTVSPSKSKNSVQYYIMANSTIISKGNYSLPTVNYTTPAAQIKKGSLKVVIENAADVPSALWSYTDGSSLYASGKEVNNIPVNTYTIKFSSVEGWQKPANQDVVVIENTLKTVTVKYTRINQPAANCTKAVEIISPKGSDMPSRPDYIFRSFPNAKSYEIVINGRTIKYVDPSPGKTDIIKVDRLSDLILSYNTSYTLVVKAYNASGVKLTEGSASFTVIPDWKTKIKSGKTVADYDVGNGHYYSEPLGHYNNVVVYYNGTNSWQNASGGLKGLCDVKCNDNTNTCMCTNYMCSEFVWRYLKVLHNISLPFKTAQTFNEYHNSNGLVYKTDLKNAKPGDVLVHDGGSNRSHVSVVTRNDGSTIDLIQQNANIPTNFEEKNLTISKLQSTSYDVKGYLAPALVTIEYNKNEKKLIPKVSGNFTSYNVFIVRKEGDCYNDYGNGRSLNVNVLFNVGDYAARLVAYTLDGVTMKSPLCYFSIETAQYVNIAGANMVDISTLRASQTKSAQIALRSATTQSSSAVSNVKIYQKIDGDLIERGVSDENGKIFAEFIPALQAGDVIVAEAEGYKSIEGVLTQTMINNNTFDIFLQKITTNKVTDPVIEEINWKPTYKNDIVDLYVDAENHNGFKVELVPDCECESSNVEAYTADVKQVTVSGLHEGENQIEITFYNDYDTLVQYKTIKYAPDSEDDHIVLISSTETSIGADVYVGNVFVKQIKESKEAILIPNGLQRISFSKAGYKPQFEEVDISTTIDLDLKAITISGNEVAVNDANNENILHVSPNPVSDVLSITFEHQVEEEMQIAMISITGQIIYTATTSEAVHTIDVSRYAAGIYILRVKVGDKIYTEKVIRK